MISEELKRVIELLEDLSKKEKLNIHISLTKNERKMVIIKYE